MAIPLMAILLGGFIFIGLIAKSYSWRIRAIMLMLAFGAPGWFYFFF